MMLPFSPQLFAIFVILIEERSGLHYKLGDHQVLGAKLSARAIDKEFGSLLDYYYFLRYDPGGSAELDALVETLLVHETYFFRELEQLRVLVDTLIAPAVAAHARPRIWCAACSTGEEPLTLAILLAERELLGSVDLVASDLSAAVLERAQRGEFGLRALRAVPPGMLGRWIEADGHRVRVRRPVRSLIEWKRINLIDPAAVTALGAFDTVLCRNALIYFKDERARQVVGSLVGALKPAGYLVVGVSESLLRFGTSLRCEERAGSFFYQKVA